ncbi:hypothetical protein CKM354_000811700 [Cercospora kikuchii]|uniref:Uncharacterized protein n=1 Tax=Cercospora kikuchii TaxID=84275 RepID=A0A9P3CLH1_9PEZI|nr:uncharacterized protein CKM354_000811700 [Cercospora kikuchii]GIZ44933.1 hypothetical protein CKM354_000811700 [Cercospora kikuchii]
MDIANTQHGSRQIEDKAYQAPTTLEIVDPVTTDASQSALGTEETAVGRKHVLAAFHELSEPQLFVDPEPKQSQHSSDWTESSSLQPKTTTCNIQPAHRWTDNLESAILSFAVALLAVYFLVFAGLAVKNDGIEIEEGSQTEWLLQAAGYGPSVFPILFAAVFGQLMTAIASWKLEKSITIGLLEQILASRSLGSAFFSLLSLRIFSLWTPVILLIWGLSPLGGQSALRVVSSEIDNAESMSDVYYLNVHNGTSLLDSFRDRHKRAINTVFAAALASTNSSKRGPQDVFGNIHIPMLEAQAHEAGADGWLDMTLNAASTNVALLGLPHIGAAAQANSSFMLETSYFMLDCDVHVVDGEFPLRLNESKVYQAQHLPGSRYAPSQALYNNPDSIYGSVLRDLTAEHEWNDTLPRRIGFQSRSYPALSTDTRAWCNITTTYIEARTVCDAGPRGCMVVAIRELPKQPCPPTATALDEINKFKCRDGIYGIKGKYTAATFFAQFMNAMPSRYGEYTPVEQYFLTPELPFVVGNNSIPIGSIGNTLFAQRFSQLLNTYWLSTLAPYAIAGNFTYPLEDTKQSSEPIADATPAYGVRATEATVREQRTVLRCHKLWLAVLVVVSVLLIGAGLTTAVLSILRTGPLVLDDFASSLRNNPYALLQQKSSMEDGTDVARRSRHVKVQLGDVQPEEEVGYIAVARPGPDQIVARIRRSRVYA